MSTAQTIRRNQKVECGLCAFCAEERNLWDYLCDSCAEKHRNRQRAKAALNKKPKPVGLKPQAPRIDLPIADTHYEKAPSVSIAYADCAWWVFDVKGRGVKPYPTEQEAERAAGELLPARVERKIRNRGD